MIKHVGINKTLGTRYVIVFREVPNDPSNCLVVESDGLNALVQDNLMNAIESSECQTATHLGEALARKTFATGENMLQYLHLNGLMRKVSVEDVILTPTSGTRVSLKEVNNIINGKTNDQDKIGETAVKDVDVTASLLKLKIDSKMSDPDFAAALTAYVTTLNQKVKAKVKTPKKKAAKVKSA
jgi:hypothetical protein